MTPRVVDIRLVQTRHNTWTARINGGQLGMECEDPRDLLAAIGSDIASAQPCRLLVTCSRAISEYGEHDQLLMLAEECAELAAAVHHAVRGRDGARDEVIGELADVFITSMQARMVLGITADDVAEVVARKLTRLEARMGDL